MKEHTSFSESISKKLILNIGLVFCASFILLFLIIYNVNYELIRRNEEQLFKAYVANTLLSVDDKLGDMCRVSLLSMSDSKTLEIIDTYDDMNTTGQIASDKYLYDFYSSLISIRGDISGIYLFDKDDLIFHSDESTSSYRQDLSSSPVQLMGELPVENMKVDGCELYIGKNPEFMRFSGKYENDPYSSSCVWMIRNVHSFSPHEQIGIIALAAPVRTLKEICESTLGDDMMYLLVTESGKVACSQNSNHLLMGAEELAPGIQENIASDKSFITDWEGRRYLMISETSGQTGLTLVTGKPVSLLNAEIFSFLKYYLLMAVAALIATVLITSLYVRRITKPIHKLAEGMEHFDDTGFDVRYPVVSNDETGRLVASFNKMMDMIQDLINREYKSQVRIKEAELKEQNLKMLYLKSQINPHFLYNTLDAIRINAQMNQDPTTSEMLMQLVEFFRLNVKYNSPTVTMDHETDLIEAYLNLMRYRYPQLRCEYDIDPELLDVEIPNFILQPMVENSLMHGLRDKGYSGMVRVSAKRNNEGLIDISIYDDGVGFNDETRKRVQDILEHYEDVTEYGAEAITSENGIPGEQSIGIRNVQRRLKMFYDEPCGLSFTENPDGGVTAHIVIKTIIENKREL